MSRTLSYTVGAEDAGLAVRDVVRREFHLVAHDAARAKYRTEGGISVNGETSLMNRVLKEGDVVRVILADEMPVKILPAEGPLDILYEDEDLICLNKPAGLVVHPSHGHFADTLANYLAHYFLKKGEPHEIRTVGRLDKDTSGVICFAKSRTAAAIMAGQTGEGAAQKTYLALAEGTFDENAGEIDAPISREYEEKIRRVVREDGAHAVTRYSVVTQYAGYALVRLRLETGRTHQIRVHMAHIGHPLLGDPIYGSARPGLARAALHAASISMKQPFTRQALMITAPLPEDMAVYIK